MRTPPPTSSWIHAKSTVGPSTKIATKKIMASASARPTWRDVSCSSSSIDWFVAISSARVPIASDCPSTMMPRRNGFAKNGWRLATESMSCDSTWMSPLGLRTATAQWSAPRIITPSTTAWPP